VVVGDFDEVIGGVGIRDDADAARRGDENVISSDGGASGVGYQKEKNWLRSLFASYFQRWSSDNVEDDDAVHKTKHHKKRDSGVDDGDDGARKYFFSFLPIFSE